jgi:hypothetical protein
MILVMDMVHRLIWAILNGLSCYQYDPGWD